jgi:hypothetical protein
VLLRIGIVAVVLVLGAVLFWTIAAGGSGNEDSSARPTSREERVAVRTEQRLAESPQDPELLLATMRAWLEAGSDRLYAVDFETQPIPEAVSEDFETGLRAWERYLRLVGDADAGTDAAEDAGDTYFLLLEIGSTDPDALEAYAAGASQALQIAGRRKRTLFTLSNLAIYAYFNGEYALGDRAAKGAVADAERNRQAAREALRSSRELGELFQGQLEQAVGQLEESGEEELAQPLRAYASSAGINKDDPRQ